MKTNQKFLVFDFGGQYKEVIARRIRQKHVLAIVEPCTISIEKIKEINPIGIVLTGGTKSINAENSPKCDTAIFELGIPVLAIGYGMHFMADAFGGKVDACPCSTNGKITVSLDNNSVLFANLKKEEIAFKNHSDCVFVLPKDFTITASNDCCPILAMENSAKKLYAVQFHPEANDTPNGAKILKNFAFKVCGAKGDYSMDDYIETQIELIRKQVGTEKVLLGLSGGVDSSVCAALISKAIPNQLICIFVDHGFMRKNEGDQVEEAFSKMDLNFVRVDAEQRFLDKVKGVTDPEQKRKIIGKEFVAVFEDESKKHGEYKFLAQGTIYPDIIESGKDNSANIKSHHNVGGLPEEMSFIGLVEPLKGLFKDEVRVIGKKLGLPDVLVKRQPFPGPGLAVRCIGELTKEKLDILRNADAIFREEIENNKVKAQQYFAILTNVRSVGVKNEKRTYDYAIAVRAILTTDFMTAEYAKIPHKVLERIAVRISTEVEGVSRVCYDVTSKPPATIEWE